MAAFDLGRPWAAFVLVCVGAAASSARADDQAVLSGLVCGSGYATSYTDIDPDAATELEFTLTLSSTVRKGCRGAVTAQFAAESVGQVLLRATATCIETFAAEAGCAVGTQVHSTFGEVAYNFSSQNASAREARSAVFVFRDLRPGVWKVDIGAADGGDAAARVGRRSLIVTAYKGG